MRFSFLLPGLALLPGCIAAALEKRATKPTFLIVPGAWHQPLHYTTLIATLIGNGYETTIVDLPTSTKGPPFLSYQADVDVVTKSLNSQVSAGKDVIMVMHSYGGVCGSAAVQGLTKTARKAAGKKGGVIGLVYMAAFAFDTGVGFKDFDLLGLTWMNIHGTEGYASVTNPGNVFYQDVAQPLKSVSEALVRNESLAIFGAVQSYAGFHDVKSTYILTTLDNAIPPALQGFFSSQTGAFGGWDVVKVASGHAPWLTHLDDVKNTLIKFAISLAS
ncbi:hypothetical protein BLS_000738 [Venturia inaequalis]|uniref:AB hydrolase-1 domain-containing protein n=1 Tax=Venturia inaequalis TaxID=5025 RepID=A0A8H3VSE7_VENIN|nr:hypothetical protein BLS_000738 [Venturia inaequalis]KAE9994175.1 hypothetical protein EG327_000882 [Venturia inaequalis]